ncbi:MAG: DedA family protein [Clostridium sp.]|uniref:DedA family protein n=1 Tax=Clostridium sp. TaxID=1506 RepID=UPI002FC66E66
MDMAAINEYLSTYGMLFIFIIFFLEYLNVPGLAAGIIMPLAGVWAKSYGANIFFVVLVTVLAGMLASFVLYLIGRFSGMYLIDKIVNKFPKQGAKINAKVEMIRKKGAIGVFICKLIPCIRTIISIPAGACKISAVKYTVAAGLGIIVWNSAFVAAGYLFSDAVITLMARG